MRRTFVTVSALALALLTTSIYGQAPGSFAPSPNTYGTASESVLSIGAFGFQGYNSFVTTQASADARWVTAGSSLVAPVNLPNGALITALEFEACDSSDVAEVQLNFQRCVSGGSCFFYPPLFTGGPPTPGCANFVMTFDPPVQVLNGTEHYLVYVSTGGTIDTRFRAVRVRYKLQVSTAPVTATFADVPTTHLFYQYIEALVAAGITTGCTNPPNPNYCPDAPITRGQMAVFLARALGLHFPN